jgi:predicted DNA-binding antitoxin AbrB/MazE fold protein
MPIIVDAIYEDGVLKPESPLLLREHEKVRVTVEPRTEDAAAVQEHTGPVAAPGPTLAERIVARAHALPEELVEQWPTDGASQHDHYLYGAPKRPE